MKTIDTRRAKCTECGYTGTLRALELHNCEIEEFGGHCEDYPACGHAWGECQTRPEHTSEYWRDVMADPMQAHLAYEAGSPEWYDALDERAALLEDAGWPDEEE